MFISYAVRWGDTLYEMGKVVGPIVIGIACICVMIWLIGLLERPITSLLPTRTIRVEVREVLKNTQPGGEHLVYTYRANKASRRERVVVEILEKDRKIRTFFMPASGVELGDVGTLTYHGRYAIVFEKEQAGTE